MVRKKESKPNLKPFDLQKAKEGKPVCTRDGRKARIICFDAKKDMPLVALITNKDIVENKIGDTEEVHFYYEDGRCNKYQEYCYDLMMLPEKRSGWAKVRKDINLYDTKEEADRKMIGNDEYVTAKVCWEE